MAWQSTDLHSNGIAERRAAKAMAWISQERQRICVALIGKGKDGPGTEWTSKGLARQSYDAQMNCRELTCNGIDKSGAAKEWHRGEQYGKGTGNK